MQKSVKKAERDGNKGAQANYFWRIAHWYFRSDDASTAITASVHAEDSGIAGVSDLTAKNQG